MLRLARNPRALRWLALPLALGLTAVAFERPAHAASSKKSKGKKKKPATGGSMDDNAGKEDVGGTAPGTTDSKASEVEMVDTAPQKKPPPGEAEDVKLEEDEDVPPEAPKVEEAPSPFPLNWLNLTIQQSFMIYGNTPGVCPSVDDAGVEYPGAAGYSCRDANGRHKGDVYAGGGNEVHAGLGLADLRFLIGYDRALSGNFLLGARFGFAILQAPAVTGTKAPMPIHGEAHFSYYFGDSPLMNKGFRPFVGFAAGVAEVDSKVSVVYYKDHIGYQNNQQGRLDVWRTTGAGFAAATGGLSYPFGSFTLNAELRVAFMFPNTAFVPSFGLGLAYGF